MHNLINLTPESQSFISFLASGVRSESLLTSIAAAKALANTASLPGSIVENIDQFYKTPIYIPLQSKLSKLNEITVVDVKTIQDYTERFYKTRYAAAYPTLTVFIHSNETAVEDFMNISIAIDPVAIAAIRENGIELMKLHNGFVKLFEDLDY